MTRRSLFKRLAGLVGVGTAVTLIKPPAVHGFQYSSRDTFLSIEEMEERYFRPAAIQIVKDFDEQFSRFYVGPKIGETINVRKPMRFIGRV